MKIAINTRFLLAGRLEGIGRYTYEVSKRLVEMHPEHQFLFLFDRPYDPSFVFAENVEPLVLTPPARHPFLWALWFEWAIPRVLKKHQVDLFFSPDAYLSLRTKVPTLLTIHDLAFEHFPEQVPIISRYYYPYFTPRFCEKAKHILAVSHYTKKDIIKKYRIAPDKISVCGNGCRPGFNIATPQMQTAIRKKYADGLAYFLSVGAVHPRKNIHRLIAAFDRFKKRTNAKVKLLIAGRFAWQTGDVKTAYDNSRFKDDIVFLGYVSDEDLPLIMSSALAFVYPSLFEGFGIPLLEAMHAEVPLITSYVSSMPEVAGKAAKLIDPLIVDQIAIAMQELHADAGLRQRLVAAGRTQRENYSWDKTAQSVSKALFNLIA